MSKKAIHCLNFILDKQRQFLIRNKALLRPIKNNKRNASYFSKYIKRKHEYHEECRIKILHVIKKCIYNIFNSGRVFNSLFRKAEVKKIEFIKSCQNIHNV